MKMLKRPNILVLYTDQQRKDSIGCYGNALAKTPNLDKLASEGVMLQHYFVQNPVCMPSRMSFLTGRYCSSLGIGDNGPGFPADGLPVNGILKPYGYHTAQIGKLHFQPHAKRDHRDPPRTYGFDTLILSDEPGCYDDAYIKWVESIDPGMVDKVRASLPPAALKYGHKPLYGQPRETHEPYLFEGDEAFTHSSFVASEMCNFLKNRNNTPFFAIAGFYAPHAPVNPPKRFVEMFETDKMPLPSVGKDEIVSDRVKEVSEEKWKEIAAYYLALVSHVDHCVGDILRTLKECGLEKDTIVIFTSDHGEYLGDHGRIGKGNPGHDCIINVPFIIRYPGKIPAGKIEQALVEGVDVVPTLLDYCGIQIPRVVQGRSFRALLEGREGHFRDDVFMEYFRFHGIRSSTVRTEQYKYYCDSSGKEILYDLKEDPKELENVIGHEEYRDVLADMRKRMIVRLYGAANPDGDMEAEY